jgi:hypothetical protein
MVKRAAEGVTPPEKVPRSSDERDDESSFEEGTTVKEWSPTDADDRVYILRFIHGETCCESPYAGVDDWPVISYTEPSADEGEPDHEYILHVIGAVWNKTDGKFIAFWGADEGDGHVDFYCANDFQHVEDLNPLSAVLCTEICPPMIDVFDDGSGKEREPKLLDPQILNHSLLTTLYA